MKKAIYLGLGVTLVVLLVLYLNSSIKSNASENSKIQVVSAENFWGSLVSQIGGDKVNVVSIVSDPNADPHEYESSSLNAREFNNASYVIVNGAGYDSWSDKLISASPSTSRIELNVADLLGKKNGDNPHFWYNPSYVNQVINKMASNLSSIDPKDSTYFSQQLNTLKSALSVYQTKINDIKQKFGGTQVAATEDIFVYLAAASGLDLVSPAGFTQAVAEGNDPPTSSVITFQNQLNSRSVKLLVYNTQTVTPLTNSMKSLANTNKIPIVGVSETIQPSNLSFQDWMSSQVNNLYSALNSEPQD